MIRILSPRTISRRLRSSAAIPTATKGRQRSSSSSSSPPRGDGAPLPDGGFWGEEGLRRWAVRAWNETEDDPYVDWFSHDLTRGCADWLNARPDPSHHLANAYFGSPRFAPERLLLAALFGPTATTLPARFERGDAYLAWTVKDKTPRQVICEWGNDRSGRGATVVAFDPEGGRVFHGNCVESRLIRTPVFRALTGFHVGYAKFLLGGMAGLLEREAAAAGGGDSSR